MAVYFLEVIPPTVQYQILEQIGQGQFGRVYKASHLTTGKLVALKELDQRRFPTNRFLREFNFLVSLQHPNIVTCLGMEHHQQQRYLVMDYCDGGDLRHLMDSTDLSLAEKLKLVTDILLGLEHAHSRDIIHCDLKPENILLAQFADHWKASLSDFGVAHSLLETNNKSKGGTGSPAYMAPEQFYGKYSLASDLYAVGVILFELLVGVRPFSGTFAEVMTAHINQPVVIPDTVPFILRSTLLRSMQKLPQHRFSNAGEMLKSIRLATEVCQHL